MDSNQLNCYAEMLKIADFLGVYASDELSSIPTLETGMLIFNTDPSKLDQGALGMSDPCGTLQLALKPNSVPRINCLLSNFYFCAN